MPARTVALLLAPAPLFACALPFALAACGGAPSSRSVPAAPPAAARAAPAQPTGAQPGPPFRIHVVDAATGRGVPMVELETVHHVLYVTDSAGMAAVYEPGLMGRVVFFHVRSHGYRYPEDGFGYRGFRVRLEPGGAHRLEIERVNIAERLYRVTGQGIYRDSLQLGDRPPRPRPPPAGGVLGQDSVVNAAYRGRLFWFWGDTNRASYPLGNFEVSGATSLLPAAGGLAPDVGVELRYFVDERGFSRPMCPIEGPGPVWIDGLMVVERDGEQRMLCHYARMKDLGTRHEHGLAVWDDAAQRFEKLVELPLDAPSYPAGHPFRVDGHGGDGEDGGDWIYFANPYPEVRVRARWQDVTEPDRYQAFTCLAPGSRWTPEQGTDDAPLERDAAGALAWRWKSDTSPVTSVGWARLVERGAVRREEGWMNLADVETGKPLVAHRGTVAWNDHRRRFVMIFNQVYGSSMLGEVWYAEAGSPLGGWRDARKIVTHDRYSFYNVRHHPYFDQAGGRLLYFEGTYTSTFSGSPTETPRYDYNQIMYRLDLEDPRLGLTPADAPGDGR